MKRGEAARVCGIGLLLLVGTLVVYAQVVGFDFVLWDDGLYVGGNPHVLRGLSVQGALWALQSFDASNWHPLTWLSHMLDCTLFGARPAGHHATNLLLHVLDAWLLFAFLRRASGATWRSGLAAGFFALHPLGVAVVAHVAQRKDVLGAAMGLSCLLAYVGFVRRGGALRYLSTAGFFALALMSKPTWVTLPLLLLLLDRWPLARIDLERCGRETRRAARGLLLEKLPLLALSLGAGALTLAAQQGARAAAEPVPAALRAANAVVAVVRYLGKALWPADLFIFYPHPYMPGGTPYSAWQVALAGAALVALTGLALRARRRPWLATGWLWFLIALAPTLGAVQVGGQAMADRYAYLPLIGLCVIAAWGLADLARALAPRRGLAVPAASLVAAALLLACMDRAHAQARVWRDSVALFEHALRGAPDQPMLLSNLAAALADAGRPDEAIARYRDALRVDPEHAGAHYGLGNLLAARGDLTGAVAQYREALRIDPEHSRAHNNLGNALRKLGDLDGAIAHYRLAAEAAPANARAWVNLGNALSLRGEHEAAIEAYRRALAADPGFAAAHYGLGLAYEATGRREEALARYRAAVRLAPRWAKARSRLARALAEEAPGAPAAAP